MKDGPQTRKISARGLGVATPASASASASATTPSSAPAFAPSSVPVPVPAPSSSSAPVAAWDGSAPVVLQQGAPLAGVYEPLIELASGGMARVVVGRRVGAAGFQRLVVIKQVHRHLLGKPDFANFFRDEARIASLIHHANVVPVIDVVEAPGELLLVMEYVESVSLSLLRSTANKARVVIPPPVVFRIFLDMLAGLHAAHDLVDGEGRPLDVVHRDVSPQNVIVGVDGLSRLIDFGVAKASHRLTETESGDIKGKYAYMSPEQVAGLPIDRRSDVFAAAVVLFETLTGVRLFAGEHAMETLRRVVDAPLPDLRAFPSIPVELHDVFARGLAKDPAHRIPTAAALEEAIESRVPVASHRRVAEWVTQNCGAILAERRLLLEESRKTGLTRSGENRTLGADEAGRLARRDDFTTQVQSHTPSHVLAQDRDDLHIHVATVSTTASDLLPRPQRGRLVPVAIAVAAALALLAIVMVWTTRRRELPGAADPNAPSATAAQAASAIPSAAALPSATAPTSSAGPSHAAASAEAPTKKAAAPRRPAATPRPDDLQGDPYGPK